MHSTNKKELFNIAYVIAMAAQAGLNYSDLKIDNDSVDLTLTGKNWAGKWRNPKIDLQLKCTSQDLIAGDCIKFTLSKKNYDDLRGDNVVSPRYLVVLLVPSDDAAWMQHHAEHSSLHNLCYWVSIKDLPDTTNRSSVTVSIPLAQRLTTEQLKVLMTHASNRSLS